MPRKRFKTEEIIQKLREVEVLLSIRNATCVEQLRDLRVFCLVSPISTGTRHRR